MSDQQPPTKEYRIPGREQTIFRVKKSAENPYVMIDRRPIDNPDLSFKAKGILTYLMSRPDGWEVNITDLMKHGKEGAAAIRTGLRELRDAHHVNYIPARMLGRITGWIIEVYEIPYVDMEQVNKVSEEMENEVIPPDDDFLHVENLQIENRGQVLMSLSNTDSEIDSNPPKVEAAPEPVPDPVIAWIIQHVGIGAINARTADDLRAWRDEDHHSDEWILKALAEAESRASGKSGIVSYANQILIGWLANGYPKSRAEQVQSARKSYRPGRPQPAQRQQTTETPEHLAERMRIAATLVQKQAQPQAVPPGD